MLNQRFTIKRDFEDFPKVFPEMVVGASFTVTKLDGDNVCYGGIVSIMMDSGTEYNIDNHPECWCFYTDMMVKDYLNPAEPLHTDPMNTDLMMEWKKKERELIEALETHRKNIPSV
ncbi:hypothetical protein 65p243 [Aeromonas phage 65]|uniref:Uncharacterized protein n=2 Tax=Ishigurovirus osborne TaxID=260149 RepID=A0A219YCA0_9CAUD|nr:hypothetical protein ST65p243 [Aeromonas phage 65]ADQ53251.1 hypothetical protein 65p243 [Aeromonas phage 65]APU01626.1 hypothetical protein [Aeromonas phage 65.2]